MKELIKELCSLRAVSGFEYRIGDIIRDKFQNLCDEVNSDTLGNVIAIKRCNKPDCLKVLIEAHIDEIGLMVKNIDENGFISVLSVGGVDQRILPAAEVVIHGKKDIKGIVGAKPPHITSAGERNKSIKLCDMLIDTGRPASEVSELVRVGDIITFDVEPTELCDEQLTSKSIDDRSCVAILLEVMKAVRDKDLAVDLYLVASAQEEVGGFGAMAAAFDIYPDIAIAIDVCHGITPDNSKDAFEIGSGAVITCGANIHPAIFEALTETAKKHNIKYSVEAEGGNTGTDAWEMQVVREGIPTALLSVPLKYMHTSVETISVSDAEAVRDILIHFVSELDGKGDWICY